jgi:Flp pilus assembly protein TadG
MWTALLKQQSGAISLEYSVSALVFLVLLLGILEICSATYTYTVLADAANEGVHYAVLNSADQDGAVTTVKNYAKSSLHDTSNINVAVSYPDGTTSPPSRVAVSVSYDYVPYLSTFMSNPPTMHAFAEGRLVR